MEEIKYNIFAKESIAGTYIEEKNTLLLPEIKDFIYNIIQSLDLMNIQ